MEQNVTNPFEGLDGQLADLMDRLEGRGELQVKLAEIRSHLRVIEGRQELEKCLAHIDEGLNGIKKTLEKNELDGKIHNVTGEVQGIKSVFGIVGIVLAILLGAGSIGATWHFVHLLDLEKDQKKKLDDTEAQVKLYRTDLDALRQRPTELKRELLETARALIIDDVENQVETLEAIDLLRSTDYSMEAKRNTLRTKDRTLRMLERDLELTDGYERFLSVVLRFSEIKPRELNKATLDELLKSLMSVRNEDRRANFWYFIIMVYGRLHNWTGVEEALDEVEKRRAQYPAQINARFDHAKLLLRLLRADSASVTSDEYTAGMIRDFEAFVTKYPKFWPARVSYAAFHLRRDYTEGAIHQLRIAVQGGGASLETVLETVEQDVESPIDGSFVKLRDRLEADSTPGQWKDKLREELRKPLW